jgi:hypothetical protein
MLHTFRTYPYSVKATFTCGACRKAKRTRTFTAECTYNPFNKGDDGHILLPHEVRDQSKAEALGERDKFMREPLCVKCEDALSFKDRAALRQRRATTKGGE